MSDAMAGASDDAKPIDLRNLVWCALALAVMIGVIQADNRWALNFLHVMCGVLWTGIDLFMGFVVGPIMRSLPPPARRAMILRSFSAIASIAPCGARISPEKAGLYSVAKVCQ